MIKVLIVLLPFFNLLTYSQEVKEDEYEIKFIVARVTKVEFLELMELELKLDKKQLEEIKKVVLELERDGKLEFNNSSVIFKQNNTVIQAKFKHQKSILTASFTKILTYYQLKKWHLESDNWK